MNNLLKGLLAVIFPQTCPCCGRVMVQGERLMCLACRVAMPLTSYHLSPRDNDMLSRLNGAVMIEKAAAYFYYNRLSPYSALIHDAKYRNRPKVITELAREYARLILPTGFFDDIDAITFVPLNFWKECRRGYNQSARLATGLAEETNLPAVSTLRAARHSSQARKTGAQRRTGVKGVFSAKRGATHGIDHILLVDDICTTGATLCACAEQLHLDNPNLRISALTIASTRIL